MDTAPAPPAKAKKAGMVKAKEESDDEEEDDDEDDDEEDDDDEGEFRWWKKVSTGQSTFFKDYVIIIIPRAITLLNVFMACSEMISTVVHVRI